MYAFLIERVRANLHIVLCMSPIGDDFRNRLRQYPALVNCTTIDWFCDWPKEALLEVAVKYIADINFVATITGERLVSLISLEVVAFLLYSLASTFLNNYSANQSVN